MPRSILGFIRTDPHLEMRIYWLKLLVLGPVLWAGTAWGGDVALTVDVQPPMHPVSSRLVGVFFEDINFGGDGGLSAEFVKNGAFEFPQTLMGWSGVDHQGANGSLQVLDEHPTFSESPIYLRIGTSTRGGAAANEGYRGIGVRAGERYQFAAPLRAMESSKASLQIELFSGDGQQLAAATISDIGAEWDERTAVLQPSRTAAKSRLVLTVAAPGAVDVDLVSLCPEKTWKGRPHGLRADLAQLLADLKLAFLRFPGGCIVEGFDLDLRYQWKNTIGDRHDRHLIKNRWNTEFAHRPTPDYFQSFALGFYEFFQLAEDIGAEPLPIVNCGMACQFNSSELVPLDELGPYIQDALDLIEFANGAVTSPWGARRAAMGHPEPFHVKLLGVGNEQSGPQYIERYEAFAKVLSERHPEIELVSGAGPFPGDAHFRFAGPRLRKLGADVVDEHCYAMPDWFLRSATRFDSYDRTGPKVFMGEYAAQSIDICVPNNRNNLRCALAEAAFLTGVERNSNLVVTSSYAPLLGREEAWQWRPNLIWFDNLQAYATPNYYVQQLFSLHCGDRVLPVKLDDSRPVEPPTGRIGLVTNQSSAEFADIRVERDGKLLFAGNSLDALTEVDTFRGRWEITDRAIVQGDSHATSRMQFGDHSWQDYTLTLRARKLGGREGFGVIVRNSSGGSYVQWNLGGWGNQKHGIQANLASHSVDDTTVEQTPGTIESNRWYEVKVQLVGSRVRCYLDGALVHDVDIPPLELPRLFAASSHDSDSAEIILKVVNPTEKPATVDVNLSGVATLKSPAQLVRLHGGPEDENCIAQSRKITPVNDSIELSDPNFRHDFPANSFTVLRLGAE